MALPGKRVKMEKEITWILEGKEAWTLDADKDGFIATNRLTGKKYRLKMEEVKR